MIWPHLFSEGVQSIAHNASYTLRTIGQFQYLWGFLCGIVFSTVLHMIVISERPQHLPRMIFYDAEKALSRMYPDGLVCLEPAVIEQTKRTINTVQLLVWVVLAEFFGLILIALLFF